MTLNKIYKMSMAHWIHYALLTAALFLGFYTGERFLNLSQLNSWQMYLFWFAVIVTADRLIHVYYLKEK